MIRTGFVLALAGCWTDAPSAPTNAAARPASAGSFPVPARELADPRRYAQLDHHAWITHLGHAWIRRDEPMQGHPDPLRQPRLFAVIDRRPDAVRVVSDEDDARVAVWIARGDVDLTITAPVELADEGGASDPVHGLWLDPGVTITAGASRSARRDRTIGLVDPELRASGYVGDDALGPVWVGPVPPTSEAHPARAQIAAGASIRVGPAPDARVLAQAIERVDTTATPAAAGWQEVDVRVRGIHVRGFVRTTELTSDVVVRGVSTAGSGYGMSDTENMIVDAGACLYDRKGGDVIGVNTATRERYAFSVGEEWPSVYVSTPWDITLVTVHDLAPEHGPRQLESCAITSR